MSASSSKFTLDDDAQSRLDEAFEQRNKILAVKIVHESCGIGLAEAKSYVDSLITNPEDWPEPVLPPELASAVEEMMRSGDLIIVPPPYVRPEAKVGRNESCPCGSGKKYKKCCGA